MKGYGSVNGAQQGGCRPILSPEHGSSSTARSPVLLMNTDPCILTHLLNHSMELSPSGEANRFSASQEIFPHFMEPDGSLPKSQVPATCPYPEPASSWLMIVHTPTSHFLKIHLNIFLPSTPGSPKWPLSLTFPHQNPVYVSPLSHTRYMHRPSHSRFYHPNNIG